VDNAALPTSGPAATPPTRTVTSPRQILCVKWGTKFGPEYVNRLHAMATRHSSQPVQLICLTDDDRGVHSDVRCVPLPELGVPHPVNTIGKWRKVVLWGRDLTERHGLSGPALFVDLDSVIVDNIDGYFEYGAADEVILTRNWAKPFQRLGQTSVFRFPIGRYPQILDTFRADPQGVADRYRFEQHYITASVPGGIRLWPESWTKHFRLHCLPWFPMRYWQQARIPRGTKIVTFPGGPNPDEVIEGRWGDVGPAFETAGAHWRRTFTGPLSGRTKWQHLKHFVLPPDWLAEHWRE